MVSTDDKSKESRALFKLVEYRYGRLLVPTELREVRRGVERLVETAEALRSVKLKNSDEPFVTFTPIRKDE
jgi:hypothetical protein